MSAMEQGLHEVPLTVLRPQMGVLSTLSQLFLWSFIMGT